MNFSYVWFLLKSKRHWRRTVDLEWDYELNLHLDNKPLIRLEGKRAFINGVKVNVGNELDSYGCRYPEEKKSEGNRGEELHLALGFFLPFGPRSSSGRSDPPRLKTVYRLKQIIDERQREEARARVLAARQQAFPSSFKFNGEVIDLTKNYGDSRP